MSRELYQCLVYRPHVVFVSWMKSEQVMSWPILSHRHRLKWEVSESFTTDCEPNGRRPTARVMSMFLRVKVWELNWHGAPARWAVALATSSRSPMAVLAPSRCAAVLRRRARACVCVWTPACDSSERPAWCIIHWCIAQCTVVVNMYNYQHIMYIIFSTI